MEKEHSVLLVRPGLSEKRLIGVGGRRRLRSRELFSRVLKEISAGGGKPQSPMQDSHNPLRRS